MRNELFTLQQLNLEIGNESIFDINHQNLSNIYQNHRSSFEEILTDAKKNKELVILDLGCANGDAVLATLNLLKAKLSQNTKIKYVGVDIDQRRIDQCEQRFTPINEKLSEQNIELVFHQLDAAKISSFTSILKQHEVDLVIMRHPVLYENFITRLFSSNHVLVNSFKKMILHTIPHLLRPDGMIFASFYHDSERAEFKRLLDLSLSNKKPTIRTKREDSTGSALPTATKQEGRSDQFTTIIRNYCPKPVEALEKIQQKECTNYTGYSYASKLMFYGATFMAVNYVGMIYLVPDEQKESWDESFGTSFFNKL